MSARLLKGTDAAVVAFAPLPLPGIDEVVGRGGTGPLTYVGTPPAMPAYVEESYADPREEADAEAMAILDRARAEAARLVADAKANAANVEREARERGLAEAHEVIAGEVDAAVAPLRDQLAATLEDVSSLQETFAIKVERDTLRLALEIARKIVMRETTTDPDVALTLVRVALDRLRTRSIARIHLHPDDCAYVSARADRLNAGGGIEIVEDPTIHRGGCLVKTDMGEVDARIERQFAEIERGLLSV